MTYADNSRRQALIEGLHALADYLEVNPDVPAPRLAEIFYFPFLGSDEKNRKAIDVIAEQIGTEAEETTYRQHHVAMREFGPVSYRAVAIPCEQTGEGQSGTAPLSSRDAAPTCGAGAAPSRRETLGGARSAPPATGGCAAKRTAVIPEAETQIKGHSISPETGERG
jgi:hypothetical protein